MLFVYFVIDDPKLKKMVLLQGCLSLGLMFSLMYYQKKLAKRKEDERRQKMAREERENVRGNKK